MGLLTYNTYIALVPGPVCITPLPCHAPLRAHATAKASYTPKPWQPLRLGFLMRHLQGALLIIILFLCKNAKGQNINVVIKPIDSFAVNYIIKGKINNPTIADTTNINTWLNTFLNNAKQFGYYGASVDNFKKYNDTLLVNFFAGQPVQKINIAIKKADEYLIDALLKNNTLSINPFYWDTLANNLLTKLADKGYPFANVQLTNFNFDNNNNALATLNIENSIKYKIDSIVFTDTNTIISKAFLYKYVNFKHNTYYSTNLIKNIAYKLNKLPYLTLTSPPELNLLNTGAYITLNTKSKNANTINALLGLVPSNNSNQPLTQGQPLNNRYSLIGQANIKLWNLLGSGEYLALNFEQLIPKHPRLQIETKIPYVLNSNFPAMFKFDFYRRDTLFINIAASISTSITTAKNSSLTLGLQWVQTNTVGININTILQTKQLPNYIDSRFFGVVLQYDINKIENTFYPRKQGDIAINLNGGTRIVKKNNEILNLRDPLRPSFSFAKLYDTVASNAPQIKWTSYGQYFVALKKLKVLKCALRVGALVSNKVFFNEQFLLGGIKTLRGFDEESQPASLFGIGTLEYRIPAGNKAYFLVFTDGAWLRNSTLNSTLNSAKSNLFASAGAGIAINGKGGLLNFIIANGVKTNDVFDLKRTKVHLGYEVSF